MEIFKLVGSIFVDTEKANESMKKSEDKASSLGGTIANIGAKAAQMGAAVVGAASTVVAGMVASAKETAEYADTVDKTSQKLGISTDAFQEWDYVLNLAGTSMGNMTTGMKTLTNKLDDAKKGSKSATAMFNKLGLSMEDLQQMNREDLFENVIFALQGMEDSTDRAALANDLFGKSGQDLTPVFNMTTEATKDLIEQTHALGIVMGEDQVAAGAKMKDMFYTLEETGRSLMNSLGSSVIPVITELGEQLLDYMPQIREMIDQMTPVVVELFSMLLPPLMQLISTLLPPLMSLIQALMPIITALIVPIVQLVSSVLPPVITIISEIITWFSERLNPAIEITAAVFETFANTIGTVFENIKNFVRTPVNAVIGFLNGLINGVTGGINTVIRALNRLQVSVPSWVTTLTGLTSFGFNIPEVGAAQIPYLAKGGVVEGSAIVGEDGPELLTSIGNSTKVTPLNENNNEFTELRKTMEEIRDLLKNGFGVYLNSRAIVGQLAPGMNSELGRLARMEGRYA